MLIIPYQTRFTAKSLPVVTLALIVINALVYFVFQAGDRQTTQRAAEPPGADAPTRSHHR